MKPRKHFDTLHIYCTGDARKKLTDLAALERRSLSMEVQALIDEAHKKRFGKTPSPKPE